MRKKVLDQDSLAEMASEIFRRVTSIKERNPTLAREIDRREAVIRANILEISNYIKRFSNVEERKLVKILVAKGLEKDIDEFLAD